MAPVSDIGGDTFGGIMSKTAAVGMVGGITAELTGGSFEGGLQSAAFTQLFNDNAVELQNIAKSYISRQINAIKAAPTFWHFEGRAAKNINLPSYGQATGEGSQWNLLSPEESVFHDDGVGNAELKYIHPDGREADFNGDTLELLTHPEYIGTYNYVNPAPKPQNWYNVGGWGVWAGKGLAHGLVDVAPYLVGGNVRGPY